jgi:hypothetical protein
MLLSSLTYTSTLKKDIVFPPKGPLAFNRLHVVISKKIELFIVTALRTSGLPAMEVNK